MEVDAFIIKYKRYAGTIAFYKLSANSYKQGFDLPPFQRCGNWRGENGL